MTLFPAVGYEFYYLYPEEKLYFRLAHLLLPADNLDFTSHFFMIYPFEQVNPNVSFCSSIIIVRAAHQYFRFFSPSLLSVSLDLFNLFLYNPHFVQGSIVNHSTKVIYLHIILSHLLFIDLIKHLLFVFLKRLVYFRCR